MTKTPRVSMMFARSASVLPCAASKVPSSRRNAGSIPQQKFSYSSLNSTLKRPAVLNSPFTLETRNTWLATKPDLCYCSTCSQCPAFFLSLVAPTRVGLSNPIVLEASTRKTRVSHRYALSVLSLLALSLPSSCAPSIRNSKIRFRCV